MMRKNILIFIALLSVFVSCQKIDVIEVNGGKEVDLFVNMEAPATKVSLGDVDEKGKTPILWSENEEIKVFSADAAATFTLTEGAGTRNAKFNGVLEGEATHAIFPSSITTADSTKIILPSRQYYKKDGITQSAIPMIARVKGSSVNFKNLCGILKLQLSSSDAASVKSITLWTGDKIANSNYLAGKASVTYRSRPSLSFDARASRYITLDCSKEMGGGVTLSAEPTTFYIVVPPTTTNFFSIEVETIDNKITYKRTQANDLNLIKRSEIKEMGNLTLSGFEDKYARGTFVLNEGNMTDETGTLAYISPFGVITDSVYFKANGTLLGNSSQDLFMDNERIYFISQNGEKNGAEGFFSIANAKTLKKEKAYKLADYKTLSWPTHVAVVEGIAYIRDNKGVYSLDLSSDALTYVDGTKGAMKNRMAVVGSKVFVPAGNKIYVIENKAVSHTITLPGTTSGVIKSDDGNLFVACTTNPAQILKINPTDYSVIKTNTISESKVGAGWGATPGISAKGDIVYLSNAGFNVYKHNFSTGETTFMTDVKQYVTEAAMLYNNLAVHPETEEVFVTTIKGYGMAYKVNDISAFDFTSGETIFKYDFQEHNSFPAGTFFPQYFNGVKETGSTGSGTDGWGNGGEF